MKKLLVLLLSICLVMASTVGVYANEAGNYVTPKEISDEYQDLNDVNTVELSDDISVLETMGFDENNIIGVIQGNDIEATKETKQTEEVLSNIINTENCNTFAYQLTDDIVSEITVVEETEDGGVVLDIVEGGLHNVVFVDDNGDIFLDGNLVEFSGYAEENEYGTLTPNSYTLYGWSESAIPPTKRSDYTINQGTTTVMDINIEKAIKDVSTTALGVIIGGLIGGWFGGIIGGVVGFFASKMKTFGERVAPNTAHFSYKIKAWGTKKSTSSTTYTCFEGTVYAQKNLKGASTNVTMYKRATRIAK